MKQLLQFWVNQEPVSIEIEPHLTLLEILRGDLGLTGTKEGCSTGHCGACTVLLDGEPISSCLLLAADAAGRRISTIEGLSTPDQLHPLAEAFVEKGGLQCGFCTPGVLMSAKALLNRLPNPTEDEIRHALAGNLCRCTGYDKIVAAVIAASKEIAHA